MMIIVDNQTSETGERYNIVVIVCVCF